MSSPFREAVESLTSMREPSEPTEADAVRFLDRGGFWQWRQLILILLAFVSSAQSGFVIVFIGFQPKFFCRDVSAEEVNLNDTEEETFNDVCFSANNATTNVSEICHSGFRYNIGRQESIVSEWDLVCDNAYLAEVSQLLYTVGMGVGAITIGCVSDRMGRKRSFTAARFLSLGCSVGIIFAPGIAVFMVLRFLIGMLEVSCGLMRAVYITELSPIKLRPVTTTLAGIFWAVSLCFEALIGHFMRGVNWRYIQAIVTGTYITAFVEIFFLNESLVWLYANGRSKQASALLKSAMKTNGVSQAQLMPTADDSEEISKPLTGDRETEIHGTETEEGEKNGMFETEPDRKQIVTHSVLEKNTISLLEILKNKTTRVLILIICAVWFVNSLVYYGLFLMSSAMVGDRILNFFIVAAVEIPACSGLYLILRRFGRRKALIGGHGMCAVSLSLAGVFNFALSGQTKVIAMQIVTFVGKFGISATYLMLYFYTAEILPTNFRTSGLGIASFSARCGSFLSPFSSVLLRVLPWGPGIIFGSLCLVVTGLLFLVPEIGYRKLPQTITEIETWKNEQNRKQ